MERVAGEERLAPEELRQRVAKGEVGGSPTTKTTAGTAGRDRAGSADEINVNLGVSNELLRRGGRTARADRVTVALKADALMDLSSYGRPRSSALAIAGPVTVMVGTVPVYDGSLLLKRI